MHGGLQSRLLSAVGVAVQIFFAATGVSDGDLLRGVRYFAGGATTNSIVMRLQSGTGVRLKDAATCLLPHDMHWEHSDFIFVLGLWQCGCWRHNTAGSVQASPHIALHMACVVCHTAAIAL